VRGEELALTFPADSFDIVHCANALDHCYDPLAVLDNMLVIARQGGRLLLSHLVDEGEAQRYLGLHQWNLRQDNRHLILWNRVTRCDVTDHLRDRAVVECRSTVRRSRPHVECVIIKS
jgi:SAM-dependent methyltransferase